MKIITYVVIVLLVATLGAGAWVYINYKPIVEEHARMKADMPAYEKATADLKKMKEKELKETAWIKPAIDALSVGLGDQIKAGLAEVLVADNKVVVNIAEQALFMPGSYTFSKGSPQLRSIIAGLLKHDALKGKNISIGNTTQAAPSQGKGRRKIPAKDARTLAGDRSAALIKDFEKTGVNQDALVAAAYSAKQPELGFKLKDHKTVIIIENPPMIAAKQEAAPAPQTPAKSSQETKSAATAPAPPAAQAQPKPIPIQPAQPKAR